MGGLDPVAGPSELSELIGGFRSAVIASVGLAKQVRRRPMLVLAVKPAGDLWFATAETFTVSDDLREDPRLSVRFADDALPGCIVVHGTAAVVHDQRTIDELWTPAMLSWFPGGPTDRDLILVRLAVSTAAYWETAGGPVHPLRLTDMSGPSAGHNSGTMPSAAAAIEQAKRRA